MAQRKIRTKSKSKSKEQREESTQYAQDPLELLDCEVEQVTESDLERLVDACAEWDVERKTLERRVKGAKALLMSHARREGWTRMWGSVAECKISPRVSSIPGTVTEYAKILKKEGKTNLLDATTKVIIGEAKKYLGEEALKEFIKKKKEKFGSISVKLRK